MVDYRVCSGEDTRLKQAIKLIVQCLRCQTSVLKYCLVTEQNSSGAYDDQICLAECCTGVGTDWKQVLYNNAREDMAGGWLLGDHGVFQMFRQGPGRVMLSIVTYLQLKTQEQKWIIKIY